MQKDVKIYVSGHTGMVGSTMIREFRFQGYENIVIRTHKDKDV